MADRLAGAKLGVSVLALLAAAAPALAQGPTNAPPAGPEVSADANIEDIVVTARRFEERLQDVPIAVSALTSEDLGRQAIDDLGDIAEKTVGLSFESLSGLIVQPAIRGQTNLRVDSPVQNVAFYLDGIYLQRGYLVDQSLLDLQRVEVIKGPQSALYGRNAFAGAINLVTRAPSLDDLTARVSGTVGTDKRYDARGALGVPIIPDRLGVFVNVAHSQFDGTWRNNHPLANADGAITEGNLGGYNKEAYQGRVIAKLSDALTFDAMYIRTERFIEALPTYTISTANILSPFNTLNASPRPGLTPPFTVQNRLFVGELPATPIVSPLDVTRPSGLVSDPRAFGLKGPTEIISGKVDFEPGGEFSLSYQYGLTEAKVRGRGSVAPNPLVPVVFAGQNLGTIFDASGSDSSFKGHSHEWKVNYLGSERVRAFAGVNFSRTRDVGSNASENAPIGNLNPPSAAAFFAVGPGLPFPTSLFQRFGFLVRNEEIWSGFGFLGIDITDRLELTLEGRYTEEDQKAVDLLTREPTNPTIQALAPPRFKRDEKYFTPRATVSFKPNDDLNIYGSVAKGVKSGGINGGVPFIPQRTYEAEENWTYEVGAKGSFLDRALQLNLAAFYTDWTNLQTSVVRLQANGTAPSFFAVVPSTVGNIGGVDVYGVEAEGVFRLADPLRLNFGASYNRSRYKEGSFSQRFGASGNCDGTVCAATPGTPTARLDVSDNNLERVPEFDGFVGLTYENELANGWNVFARGDVTYQTKFYVDEANLAFVPDRTLANASAGVTIGNLSLQAWVKNLFDKKYVTNAFFLIGTSGALSATYTPVLGDRRTAGLTASFAF
jgi:iron complex outermembrane recepter protein